MEIDYSETQLCEEELEGYLEHQRQVKEDEARREKLRQEKMRRYRCWI